MRDNEGCPLLASKVFSEPPFLAPSTEAAFPKNFTKKMLSLPRQVWSAL